MQNGDGVASSDRYVVSPMRDGERPTGIDEQYERARAILSSQQPILRQAASVLLAKETITGEELKAIVTQTAAPNVAQTGTEP